ncbi:hypothetical protein Tco_1248381 [Tanacetum coccineum]
MRELREDTFFGNKNDDAHEHVEQVLDIVSLFNILKLTHDAVMLCVFPITLAGGAKIWVDRLSPGTVDSWDLLKKTFIQSHQKVNIFYNGLGTMNCQLLDSQGPIPDMTPAQVLTTIQTMADYSQKWHDGSSSRNIESNSNTKGIAAIVKELILTKNVLLTKKRKVWRKLNTESSVDPAQTTAKSMVDLIGEYQDTARTIQHHQVPQEEKQSVSYYVEPYEPPIPFPRRLEHHIEEALVHETMESLKKIRINRPILKEIRQTNNYAKYMKDLVANKPKTEQDNEIRMNPRCFALLQNQLPPKERDPGSFILPCSIERFDFNNTLADLGASISIMPFFMYKFLGKGKLEPINMVIKMADNTKCTPKGIVENLLIKINKFIFLVDFLILDMVEDFKMPTILGRPLLATVHAKVDIFRKPIFLEVGNEKVIFKMRSSFTTIIFEFVRAIRNKISIEDDNLINIDYDLFLYESKSCEFNHLLAIDPDIFIYDINVQESYEEVVCRMTEQGEPWKIEKWMKKIWNNT